MARHFEDWIKGYIDYTRASESPLQFHFWTAISTIAGALRGKVWRDERTFRWTPNFYIVLVGPPGIAQKSTSMKLGMNLLENVEGIHFGPSSATWHALAQEMQSVGEEITYRDNGVEHKFNLSCVTLAISELGTFLKMAMEGFTDVLIDMWDGQVQDRPWTHSTVTSTKISVNNPWLNMIACTTPSWLRNNFPVSMIGGGLTSRILFIFGDKKRSLVAYPSQHYRGSEFTDLRKKLIADLIQIAELKGPFAITPAAIEWGEEWYANLWTYRPPHLASERFDTYISRKQVYLHKLAMVRAAATGDRLVLDTDHLKWSDAILGTAERYMGKVFQSIGLVDQAVHVEALARLLRQYGRLTSSDLYSMVQKSISFFDFGKAVEAGIHAGALKQLQVPNAGKIEKYLTVAAPPKLEEETNE